MGLGWYDRYARSKLCNVLFASELRRKYPAGPMSVAISPGLVNTGIFHSVPDPLGQVLQWLASKSFQTPEEGAQHIMKAISAVQQAQREAQGAGGTQHLEHFPLYWHCSKPQEPSKTAMDERLAAALWRASDDWARSTVKSSGWALGCWGARKAGELSLKQVVRVGHGRTKWFMNVNDGRQNGSC